MKEIYFCEWQWMDHFGLNILNRTQISPLFSRKRLISSEKKKLEFPDSVSKSHRTVSGYISVVADSD